MKKFIYELEVETVEHSQDTVQKVFGTDFYNPDFPEDTHARALLDCLFRDAISSCYRSKSWHLADRKTEIKSMSESDQQFHKYLDNKIALYEGLAEKLKCVRTEIV